MNAEIAEFKPSEGYFRRALRASLDPTRLRAVGFAAVDELEALRNWIREKGIDPPQFRVLLEEAEDRGLELEKEDSTPPATVEKID